MPANGNHFSSRDRRLKKDAGVSVSDRLAQAQRNLQYLREEAARLTARISVLEKRKGRDPSIDASRYRG
jgi:hypothetical protein